MTANRAPGTWIFLPVLFLFLMPTGKATQYIADRWETQAAVQNDGSLWVTENIRSHFLEGNFTDFHREILKGDSAGIVDISASMDGVPMPTEGGVRRLEITGKKDLRIVWHFPIQSISTHQFILKYRLLGAVRRESTADVLRWDALPRRHGYPIRSALVIITYPQGAEWMTPPEVLQGRAAVKLRADSVQFHSSEVKPDNGLQILLRFKISMVISGPPSWQKQEERHRRTAPYFVTATLAILALGSLALYAYYRHYCNRVSGSAQPRKPTEIPEELLPAAIAGILISTGAQLQWSQIVAVLVNLSQRGFLRIEESKESQWYRHSDFLLRRETGSEAGLLPHERLILDTLFPPERIPGSPDIRLSQALKEVWGHRKSIGNALREEMRLAGLISPERERAGRWPVYVGLGSTLFSIPLFFLAGTMRPEYGSWPLLIPAGILIFAFSGMVLTSLWSPLSSAAEVKSAHWKIFASQLTEIAFGKTNPVSLDLFEKYFPYAVSFGLGYEWIERFRIQGNLTLPSWFQVGSTGEKGLRAFSQWMRTALLIGGKPRNKR